MSRAVHRLSARKERPLIVVDCRKIPGVWFECHLFGHARSAFPNAGQARTGKFGEARDGTLVFDEIDRLPWEDQEKLVWTLRRGGYRPCGSSNWVPLRASLVATTRRPLDRETAAQRFCPELYDLFRAVTIQLVPLRQHPEWIRPLALKFLGDCGTRESPRCRLTREAWALLESYDWPGNVG